MNYSEALSFTFQDENWIKKVALGGFFALLSFFGGLIFLFGFFLVGYYVGVIRNVMNNEEKPLPEWSKMSKIFLDGIMGSIIIFVYLLIVGGICALAIVNIAHDPHLSDAELAMGCVTVSLMTLFALVIFINFGLLQFAMTENFAMAFNVVEMVSFFRHHLGDFVAITVFSLLLNGILLCAGLGIFSPFTNFWGLIVQAHLFGQCAKQVQSVSSHAVQSA
ncbi:MAG: DUF4013 domain-containing protein [bacterium]